MDRISSDLKKVKGDNNKYIAIEVYYTKGADCIGGKLRGYYMSVYPVKIEGGWRTTTAYSGMKTLLYPVSRKSMKAEKQALIIADRWRDKMIAGVLQERGLELEEYREYGNSPLIHCDLNSKGELI